jgi:hypothetical protein
MNLRVSLGGNFISIKSNCDDKIPALSNFYLVLSDVFDTDDPVAFSEGHHSRGVL